MAVFASTARYASLLAPRRADRKNAAKTKRRLTPPRPTEVSPGEAHLGLRLDLVSISLSRLALGF